MHNHLPRRCPLVPGDPRLDLREDGFAYGAAATTTDVTSGAFSLTQYNPIFGSDSCSTSAGVYTGVKVDGSNCIQNSFTPSYLKAVPVAAYPPPKSGAASTAVSLLAAALALAAAGRLAM